MNLKDLSYTKDWTLFLDRDGVISHRVPNGYVTQWEDFHFLEGVLEALGKLAGIFGKIILVSNQQGVGKGLMSWDSLEKIDLNMKDTIRQAGGRIDASFYSPYLVSENHPDRKPGIGMGHKAKAAFPGIDFLKAVMIGDSTSDIEFGKNLGMITVFLTNDENHTENVDFIFSTLHDFAEALI